MSDLSGHDLGRYHILEPLGEGGMATVYKAYDTRLEAEVAVKVIRTEALPQNAVERALKRFEREAKALARLTHPNIVRVIDYGEYQDRPYLVMPFIPGGTLKAWMGGKPMPYQEAARLLVPIARALAYAHGQGMIHRDIKPSNILITHSDDPLLTDFGIAKIIDDEATLDLTGTSAVVGTPEYMAPEQVSSKTVDHRADIYALGIVFYEMVTGRKPFQAETPLAVLLKHASEPLPRPQHFVPGLPEAVEKVLMKALAKGPENRFATMTEFAAALEHLLTSRPSRANVQNSEKQKSPFAKPAFWTGLVLLSIAGLAAVLMGMWKRNSTRAEALPPTPTSANYEAVFPAATMTATRVFEATAIPATAVPMMRTATPIAGQASFPQLQPGLAFLNWGASNKMRAVSCGGSGGPGPLVTEIQVEDRIEILNNGQPSSCGTYYVRVDRGNESFLGWLNGKAFSTAMPGQ